MGSTAETRGTWFLDVPVLTEINALRVLVLGASRRNAERGARLGPWAFASRYPDESSSPNVLREKLRIKVPPHFIWAALSGPGDGPVLGLISASKLGARSLALF